MRLRTPSENKINTQIWNDVNNKSDEFEDILLINNLFEYVESKFKKIVEKIIYEILEINRTPKNHRRSLKRSKQ